MIFVCQFGRYRYKQLPFGVAPAGNMFQRKNEEIFKDMPNVFIKSTEGTAEMQEGQLKVK